MRRMTTMVVLLAAVALVLAAVVAGTTRSSAQARSTASGATKLTVWVGWSAGTELISFKKLVKAYDQQHSDVDINVVGGINDNKIIAALRAGNAPDVVSSFSSQNVGIYCPSGGWIDLAPYLKKDHISTNIFPAASRYYTQYKGKRCALPLLADTFGLYYNKKLFKAAGLTSPPKTFSQLTAYAKKLTVKNGDGSLKVVGYDPNPTFYHGGAGISVYGTLVGATYFDKDGKSNFSRDPGWSHLFKWQKSLIDYYGYDKLTRWQTGAGDEFSASNAFETGKLAMALDGEWRVSFVKHEHPELQYATAPLPVDDAQPNLYGGGYINGTIIGIPKTGKNHDKAWELVKWLTTNDHALAQFSNDIRNVPSTVSSSKSPELIPDKHFSTFLKVFTNPHSTTSPITPIGADHLTTLTDFAVKWYSGKTKDLQGGLKAVDKSIDSKIKQAGKGGGGAP